MAGPRAGDTVQGAHALFPRALVRLIGPGAEHRSRADFAARLAQESATLCAGSEVGVVLLGDAADVVVSGSTHRARDLERLALTLGESFATDSPPPPSQPAPAGDAGRSWLQAAQRVGFASVHRVVLRDADEVVGALDVFGPVDGPPPHYELLQPLADLAAAHLSRQSALATHCARADQLERALRTRSVIEQAKGMLASHADVSLDSAFGSLRKYARDRNQRVVDVSKEIVYGELPIESVHPTHFAMTPKRRQELRERALGRWRSALADSTELRHRAAANLSQAVELRVELEHGRTLRQTEAVGRAVDRHFDEMSARRPGTARPRVLVALRAGPEHANVLEALRADPRFVVDESSNEFDLLGMALVGQPDVLVLPRHSPALVGSAGAADDPWVERLERLVAFCPDSRILLLVEDAEAGADGAGSPPPHDCDATAPVEDPQAVVSSVAALCGLGP